MIRLRVVAGEDAAMSWAVRPWKWRRSSAG